MVYVIESVFDKKATNKKNESVLVYICNLLHRGSTKAVRKRTKSERQDVRERDARLIIICIRLAGLAHLAYLILPVLGQVSLLCWHVWPNFACLVYLVGWAYLAYLPCFDYLDDGLFWPDLPG